MKGKMCGLLCGILFFLSGMLMVPVQGVVLPPQKHSVAVGEPLRFHFPAPFEKSVRAEIYGDDSVLSQFKEGVPKEFSLKSGPVPTEPGEFQVRLCLFGFIPVRDMIVSVVPQIKVIPGGQSIGVLLHSQGVIVAGLSPVQDQDGKNVNPAYDAGIMKGDVILKIDGETVQSDAQVRDLVAVAGTAGKSITLEVKRGGEVFTTRIKPVFCKETLRYRIGVMIRDSA
ncbi:MAG: PDZ domain-containing protein, partial [Firmicutes bacterium]|nr:PDZ domain-containing protein [Bacillota bacterium]